MSGLMQDLRFAVRQMGKRPGFAALVVLTMALGIGANAAIFSVLDAVLLRPLPYSQPEQLVKVWSRFTGIGLPNDQNWVSAPEFRDYQQLNRSFSELAAIDSGSFNLGVKGSPQRVVGAAVSPDLFGMLGAQALIGRTFLAEEGQPGRDHEAVLSYGLWRRVFGANRECGRQQHRNRRRALCGGGRYAGGIRVSRMKRRSGDRWRLQPTT